MDAALKILTRLVLVLVIVDMMWLNRKVVDLEQVGKVISDRLIKIEEQLIFLAFQQEKKLEPITASGDLGKPAEIEKTSTTVRSAISVPTSAVTSEVFIPLGSGSTSSTEWVDTGAQAYVDTSIYPRLRDEVYLQASLKSNSGVVFARLVQRNEGGVIGSSEISHNTPVSTFKTSASFSLSEGNKLYMVQVRSETGQEVFMENARLRLLLR